MEGKLIHDSGMEVGRNVPAAAKQSLIDSFIGCLLELIPHSHFVGTILKMFLRENLVFLNLYMLNEDSK